MRALTIDAASLESARGFYRVLGDFGVELEESEGAYAVRVRIERDRDIVEVLRALEQHIETRDRP